jgi:hypothetical protein
MLEPIGQLLLRAIISRRQTILKIFRRSIFQLFDMLLNRSKEIDWHQFQLDWSNMERVMAILIFWGSQKPHFQAFSRLRSGSQRRKVRVWIKFCYMVKPSKTNRLALLSARLEQYWSRYDQFSRDSWCTGANSGNSCDFFQFFKIFVPKQGWDRILVWICCRYHY